MMSIEVFLAVMAIIAANLGTILALYFHSDKKIDSHREETKTILAAIQTEMKDFHGRLCAIEERGRK
jgi:hypothetical protein